MNKTVTINISGIIFHIEEDAYDTLSRYLSTIKSYFNSSEGRDEIMADIESRIAELLQEKINPGKQVITMTDVEHVIGIMGKPEDFAGEEQHNTMAEETTAEYTQYEGRRRLFRDPDSKILGGVCSGIAHYFDVDVVWIRIALVALTMLGFSGVLAYIIMWVVVPEAKTTAEKLQMRREPVDINHISRTVREEAENLKKKGKEFGKRMSEKGSVTGSRFGDFMHEFFTQFFKVLGRVIGFFLIVFSIFLMIGYIASMFGLSVAGGETVHEIMNGIFDAPFDKNRVYIGLTLVLGIPMLMLMYIGIKLLFKINYSNKWIGMAAGILWVAGIAISTYSGIKIGMNFNEYAEMESPKIISHDTSKVLRITMDMTDKYNAPDFVARHRERSEHVSVNGNDWKILKEGDKKYFIGMPTVRIIRNHGDSIEVNVVYSSHGKTRSDAQRSASAIVYKYAVNDSELVLNNFFTMDANTVWRNQDVEIYVKVPDNQVVFLDKSVRDIIYDVKNTTHTHDNDMVNRRWKMTSAGLACVDCDGLPKHDEIEDAMREHEKALKELNDQIKEETKAMKEEINREVRHGH